MKAHVCKVQLQYNKPDRCYIAALWGEPDNPPKYELYNRNVLYCAVNRT